eukprot:TRINITY_DN17657_c0_g1_i1.p1 TRINITY_DN17657_c0_g1~~TRINITY_DN17657_c0_g1_i1.p1  ORF type:complete len:416 (+),score=72.67 TRINITY_DN17657_c0_g1_i1:98-1345(+)
MLAHTTSEGGATSATPSDFSTSCDAVRIGFQLLNTVEGLEEKEETKVEPLENNIASWENNCAVTSMENSQHSPPMYPTAHPTAHPTDPAGQPKVQQIHNMNSNNSNNNNNIANPLRIKHFPLSEHSDRELAELATQEISLDLQGLIDETHFPDDNLFGDLIETAKKNDAAMYGMPMGRGATPSSGSSGQNSPGSEGQNSPPAYNPYARNTLAYLPGSVHNGASFGQMGPAPPQHHHQQSLQVKQEPVDQDFSNSCSQAPTSTTNTPYNPNNYNNGVSSSTPHPSDQMSPVLPFNLGGPLPSLKSFAAAPKYLSNKKKGNGGEKCSDEYRRRRERNNVAVRKSREKAKMRTRETEDRVKILARENERLQKKVELLQEELSVLRSLFSSVGVLPDHIHRELAKHLDNFQAQHAAMNY